MKNNTILKIGIMGILVSIIPTSGCTSSSTNETKTFSDGDMSFEYPVDFYDVDYSGNEIDSSTMRLICMFENKNGFAMRVFKNKTRTSPTEAKDVAVSKIENLSNYKVLSTTTETNSNGVAVEKISYSESKFLIFNWRHDNMYFQRNDDVYVITVSAIVLDKQKLADINNIIFQSIK
ncbi:hypothetical protein [Methanobacterium ferruginis]|uniref:hypothetical protein n=1 Tax=Methanobacterium ferruginis TaxID=710191 RepID=UPI002573FD9A|nr:hypothetical protein [Methanobacterium ferruginis]BDZ67928.1 hypothetical protein GCM10025860_13760 [Methanobacterium ferruginis]